jgi:hypothetical protein
MHRLRALRLARDTEKESADHKPKVNGRTVTRRERVTVLPLFLHHADINPQCELDNVSCLFVSNF